MTLPEGYLPRKGDILIVHATVEYEVEPGEADVHVVVADQSYRQLAVPLKKVVGLYSRAWEVGARVTTANGASLYLRGEVVATHGDQVWVKMDIHGVMGTFDLEADPGSRPIEEQPAATTEQEKPL